MSRASNKQPENGLTIWPFMDSIANDKSPETLSFDCFNYLSSDERVTNQTIRKNSIYLLRYYFLDGNSHDSINV